MNKERYQIALDYSPAKQARLKKFLGIIGVPSVAQFAQESLDNEIAARIEEMDEATKASVLKLIGG